MKNVQYVQSLPFVRCIPENVHPGTTSLPASQPEFSPKVVAGALNVGESSIKRWCDAGTIRTVRTAGGHRRIPLDAVLEFLAVSRCELVQPSALGLVTAPRLWSPTAATTEAQQAAAQEDTGAKARQPDSASDFFAALMRGEEDLCRRLLRERIEQCGSCVQACEELITCSMHRAGDAWQTQSIEVYQERRACCICERLIQEHRARIIEQIAAAEIAKAPRAIGCAPSGDPYSLPSAMVELALWESGWNASNHGINLPLDTMLRAVLDHPPELVWVSISVVAEESEFIEQFNRLAACLSEGVILVVGGRGLTERLRPRLNYTAYCDNLRQLVGLATAMRCSIETSAQR